LIAQLAQAVFKGVGLLERGITGLRNALLDAVQLVHDRLVVKTALHIGTGGGLAAACAVPAAIAAAKIAVTAPTEHPEDQKEDDPGRPIAAPHGAAAVAIAVAAALIGGCHRHDHRRIIAQRHSFPFCIVACCVLCMCVVCIFKSWPLFNGYLKPNIPRIPSKAPCICRAICWA